MLTLHRRSAGLGQSGDTISASQQWCSRAAALRRHPGFARFGKNQKGDTIVEVLIAIAIVSLILTAAYVITNKNTVAIQGNQERIQAQHLAEAQIEALRAQNGLNVSGDCFDAAGDEAAGSDCNNFTAAGSGAAYTAGISGPNGGVYTVQVVWSSLGGSKANDSNVTMYYRLQ